MVFQTLGLFKSLVWLSPIFRVPGTFPRYCWSSHQYTHNKFNIHCAALAVFLLFALDECYFYMVLLQETGHFSLTKPNRENGMYFSGAIHFLSSHYLLLWPVRNRLWLVSEFVHE